MIVTERVRRLKLTNGAASASVSLFLGQDQIRGRVLTRDSRDFPRPNSSIDRAALCLTAPNATVLFLGDNRIDWDDEDEPWRMSDRVTGVNLETLVGVKVEIVNIGPAKINESDSDGACASRADANVVLTQVLTVDDVEVIGEAMNIPLLPLGLTIDNVEVIGGLIFRRRLP